MVDTKTGPRSAPGVDSFVDDTGIVYFVPRGAFTRADVQRTVERVYSDPGLRSPMRILWDLRGVNSRDLDGWTYDKMRLVATFADERRPLGRGRNAFVAASPVAFGLCRMYEMSVDPGKLPLEHRVFKDHAAAVEWLLRTPCLEARSASAQLTLDECQRRHITEVLELTGWRVRGREGAARILGIKPTTLEARMKKLGIQRPSRQAANM
jgi:hypothetical protein